MAQPALPVSTEIVEFELDLTLEKTLLIHDIKRQAKDHCGSISGSVGSSSKSRARCRADLVSQVLEKIGSSELADLIQQPRCAANKES